MDLSAYISIAARLDNSGSTPALVLTDTSSYPVGVAPTIAGCFTNITEPDGVSIGNSNFSSPDISWGGTGLNLFSAELRLNAANVFQSGGYTIVYVVRAPGYSDTTLTVTFSLSYTKPVAAMASNFNNLLPALSVQDSSIYVVPGLTYISSTYNWAGLINNVAGSTKNITSSTQVFDLAYGGSYYDAIYSISMSTTVTWSLISNAAITIRDVFAAAQNFESETPPSSSSLLGSLTFLKSMLDAAVANCVTFAGLLANYLLAQAVYAHLKWRGCASDFAGLSSYVYQLQKIFNNNVTPVITHTNQIIPAYDFGCSGGSGSSTWASITGKPSTVIVQWVVGAAGFPGNGATTLTDPRFIGFRVAISRNYIQELGYSKPISGAGSDTITFNNALSTSEVLFISTIPL